MTDAPERIWAWEYKGNSPWGPIKPDLDVVTNGAEYIRADLHAEAIEAAEARGYARAVEDAYNALFPIPAASMEQEQMAQRCQYAIRALAQREGQ